MRLYSFFLLSNRQLLFKWVIFVANSHSAIIIVDIVIISLTFWKHQKSKRRFTVNKFALMLMLEQLQYSYNSVQSDCFELHIPNLLSAVQKSAISYEVFWS